MHIRSPFWIVLVSAIFAAEATAIVPGGLVANQNNGTGTATWLEMTMTVEAAPPENSNYFWAQQFYNTATVDHNGYFGIQTGGNIDGNYIGKLFVFSMWNATAAEAGPGATTQPFGGEGVGFSVRKPVDWKEGIAYKFRVEKDGAQWWKAFYSEAGGEMVYLGRIQITEDVELSSVGVAFTEYYSDLPSCEALPYTRTFFSDFVVGGNLLVPNDAAPYGRCPAQGKGYLQGNGAVHEIGTAPGPGDANGDGSVSVSDIFYLINHLFAGGPITLGDGGDANGDGRVDVSDIFYLINHLFAGGPAPV